MMLYVVEQQNMFNHTYYKLNDKIASCNICKIFDFFFKEYSNWTWIWYSEICDISAFYFGADFPFNIGLYDNGYFIKPIYIN